MPGVQTGLSHSRRVREAELPNYQLGGAANTDEPRVQEPHKSWQADIPSLASPEPWVKSSWYCLLGKLAGKTLFIMGLEEETEQVNPTEAPGVCYASPTSGMAAGHITDIHSQCFSQSDLLTRRARPFPGQHSGLESQRPWVGKTGTGAKPTSLQCVGQARGTLGAGMTPERLN